MKFDEKYSEITNIAQQDINALDESIKTLFVDETPLNRELLQFLTAPSKRLRPLLGYLYLRSVLGDLSENQKEILLAVELVHNATLIHDDVIDGSEKRRNQKTIHKKFDSNLAVVAGDYLLSIALEKIINVQSIKVFEIFASALKNACLGEINQYFDKFKLVSIEKYIEKSKEKTAFLFEAGILAGILLSEEKDNKKLYDAAKCFSENFGIAFQIRDDLINISNFEDLKPSQNDIESGIYTAPVIFALDGVGQSLEKKEIIERIKSTGAIEKTKTLMDNYFDNALNSLKDINSNIYKSAIVELVGLLRESV